MKKNDVLEATCHSLGSNMEGVCHVDGMALFVPGMLPGEMGQVRVVKVQPRHAFGRLVQLSSSPSPHRRESDCPVYPRCGGCSGRHMAYDLTLAAKRDHVANCFARIGRITVDVPPVIGMDHPFAYRNKMALPVGGTADAPEIGFYAPRSHQLIHAPHCLNAMSPCGQVADALLQWMKAYRIPPYQEETHRGLIRHLVVRVNRQGSAMVTLVINGDVLPHGDALVETLRPLGVISLYISINREKTNVIFGRVFRKVWGIDTLQDTLCGLTFALSPPSFFQVNPIQTEKLYGIALDFADLRPTDHVVDLYCGAGTISLLLAKHCAHVTGIEIVPEAIENAKENAGCNGITNADFLAGDATVLLPELAAGGLRPRVMVADPPRKGMDAAVIRTIAHAAPERLVYVSCDAATQARDAALLQEAGYRLEQVQPVDMFCWTSGVENVAVFTRVTGTEQG